MFGKCVGDTSVAAAEGLGNGGGGASTCPNTQCFAPLCSESGSQGGEAFVTIRESGAMRVPE